MHPQPIRAVIFDIGGTVHPSDHCEKAMLRIFKISRATFRRTAWPLIQKFHLGRITERQYFVALSKALQRPMPKNWRSLWRTHFRPYAHVFPVIRKLIRQIQLRGIVVAALSNTIKPHMEISRQQGVYQKFDRVFLSCMLGMHKPDTKFYRYAIRQLGVPAKQCIYIDDKTALLKPARELGMRVVLARNPSYVAYTVERLVRR